MKKKPILLLYLLIALLLPSCEESDNAEPQSSYIKVNKFIWEVMDDIYLWQDKMPRNIDLKKESDPKEYFKKLLYSPDDKWSFITDDVKGLLASFEGNEKTFGYSLIAGKFSNSDNYFLVVEYVEHLSPASEAGIKRGDIIIKINGKGITKDNYSEIINGNTITITMGVVTDNGIAEGNQLTLTSKEMNINPLLISNVMQREGKKIAYMVYNQFITSYNSKLDEEFMFYKDNGVTDFILDLRFNSGGHVDAAVHLCSNIAPQSVVSKPEILIKNQWNTFYQNYLTDNNQTQYLQRSFDASVPVNMNLGTVYILTSKGSASASELTISGLLPYMNVVTIGDATSGKYTASATFQPTINDKGDLDPDIKNWAIQPIIFKYANSAGLTDFKNGLTPTYKVEEVLIGVNVPQLGDDNEPLLAKALELITGNSLKSVSAVEKLDWKRVERIKSKFDKHKQTLLIPNPLKD